MNIVGEAKTPWHLWVVGLVSLLWNSGGAISYTMTHLGRLESMGVPPHHIEFYSNFPAWATGVWALGVWGCLIGSLLLLLRSRFAVTSFAISIVGLVFTTIYQWGIADLPEDLRSGGHIAFAAAIWIITIALFFYAKRMRDNGVLK